MQVLFISDEAQVLNFLSGLQAEAMMPEGNVEITGIAQDSAVTVICSGVNMHYNGTITRIDSGYQSIGDSKWLGVKFMVRRNNASNNHHFEHTVLND